MASILDPAALFAQDDDPEAIMWFFSPMGRLVILSSLVVVATILLQNRTVVAQSEARRGGHGHDRINHGERISRNDSKNDCKNQSTLLVVPFIVLEEPSWRDLSVMLEKYRIDASNLLKSLSQSLELALYSEREMGVDPHRQEFLFSNRLQTRLDRASACLDHNEKELLQMMKPFPVCFVLSHKAEHEPGDDEARGVRPKRQYNHDDDERTAHLFTMKQHFAGMANPGANKSAYDCGGQVIAHIVRDWTALGQGVRTTIYDWCRLKVEEYVSSEFPILVPGAGLGRLAHDLAFVSGHTVEANEISLSMSTAAHAILQENRTGTLYPFALDSYANEVESERRYDIAQYPDVEIQNHHATKASLSYTSGDFVQIYRWQRPQATFGCVITCFFLDTATNVYEYISTIEHSLAEGGIWVNIGPLRWHHNSMLHPAADELRTMIESSFYSFEVLEWSVDETPSEYRHEDNDSVGSNGRSFVRSTSYEGYRPLRFVAKRT